jgi:hypothetical protein
MEPARRMLLHDKGQRRDIGLTPRRRLPGRLRRFAEIAFASVFF